MNESLNRTPYGKANNLFGSGVRPYPLEIERYAIKDRHRPY